MLKDFKAFVMRGNVLDLAVAVVVGGAFSKIVTSFVDDVLMPPLGLLLGLLPGLTFLLHFLLKLLNLLLLGSEGIFQRLDVLQSYSRLGRPGCRLFDSGFSRSLRHQRSGQQRNYAPPENALHHFSFCLWVWQRTRRIEFVPQSYGRRRLHRSCAATNTTRLEAEAQLVDRPVLLEYRIFYIRSVTGW